MQIVCAHRTVQVKFQLALRVPLPVTPVFVNRHSTQGQIEVIALNLTGWIQNGKFYFIGESASFRRVLSSRPKYSGRQLRLRVLFQGSYKRLRPDTRPQRRRPDMEELRDRAP